MEPLDCASILIFKLSGDTSNLEAESLRRGAEEALFRGVGCILLDFSEVGHIDSGGLGVIAAIRRSARVRGGALGVFGLRQEARHLFHVTRLEEIVPIFPDEEEAVRHFAPGGVRSIQRRNMSLGALTN
ncbi:MAG: STAS domain-containing protein [bacterium]